jgi:hypothetical protein
VSVESLLDGAFTELLGKVPRPVQGQQTAQQRVVDIAFMLGGTGVPLDGTEMSVVRLGLNGSATVISWSMCAQIARSSAFASCAVDILAGPTMTSVASICAGAPPTLTNQSELDDVVPLLWSSIPDPSWLVAATTSIDGLTETIAVTLRVSIASDPFASVVTDQNGDVVTDNNGDPVTWG